MLSLRSCFLPLLLAVAERSCPSALASPLFCSCLQPRCHLALSNPNTTGGRLLELLDGEKGAAAEAMLIT